MEITMATRYELNKELAQMLKGGVSLKQISRGQPRNKGHDK